MKRIITVLSLACLPAVALAMSSPPPAVPPFPAGGPVPVLEYNKLLVLQAPVGRTLQAKEFGKTPGGQDPVFKADFADLQAQVGRAGLAQRAPNRPVFDDAAGRIKALVPKLCAAMGGCI